MRKVLILAALALAPMAVRADDEAEKVIKKAVEAHGGEKALTAMKAGEMTIKSTMSLMGLEIEFGGEIAYAYPDKFKMSVNGDIMGQKLALAQVVNGDKVKMSVNGMAVPVEDKQKDEMKQAATMQELSSFVPLLDKKRFTLKAEKDGKVGDEETAVVSVSGKGMKDTKMFFSKKTGLLLRTQRTGLDPTGANEVDEVADLSDYKKVDGIQTPMTIKTSHDGKPFMTMKVSEMKYHEKLDAKKFAVDD
ncbi:MAG: hypothetical protein MUF18_03415 [Fimbriiglobus sp.]|jgi:hypothetical protein|nr:hypothetical protein [Fimbriiglobus sp.]